MKFMKPYKLYTKGESRNLKYMQATLTLLKSYGIILINLLFQVNYLHELRKFSMYKSAFVSCTAE